MVRAFTCLLTARSVRRFVRPFGTAGVRAAKISLSAVNQCCSASPWGEPLATHIWYARSRIRSDKCWSMLCSTSLISLILLSAPSSLPVRYLILPGRATASIGAATGDMRANDVRPTPHLAPSGLLLAVLPLRHGVVAGIRAFCINVRGFVHSDAEVSITLSTVWKWLMEGIAVRCCISSTTRSRHSLRNRWAAGSALRGSFSASRICFSYAVSRCCTPSRTAPEFFP